MRVRHIVLGLLAAAALSGALVGCDLLGMVSIDQRITDFQTSLNGDRTTLYENFHPTLTSDYNALKDPTTTIDPLIPVLGTGDTPYSLSITDQGSPSTGVMVTISGGGSGWGPKYLKLVMETTGTSDYRIVSLEIEGTNSFPGPAQLQ